MGISKIKIIPAIELKVGWSSGVTMAVVRLGGLTSRVQAAAAVVAFRPCDLLIVNSQQRQRLTENSVSVGNGEDFGVGRVVTWCGSSAVRSWAG